MSSERRSNRAARTLEKSIKRTHFRFKQNESIRKQKKTPKQCHAIVCKDGDYIFKVILSRPTAKKGTGMRSCTDLVRANDPQQAVYRARRVLAMMSGDAGKDFYVKELTLMGEYNEDED
ncbi:MAG TPA: hypothetical protein ENK70_07475 [Methylophaga sp.]|nr:hypothetical protein [Methylophaga sp.]